MRLVKLLFKIISAPLVVLLTIITPTFSFLLCCAVTVLNIIYSILFFISKENHCGNPW